MKFICISCNEYMKLMKADNSKGDTVNIIFGCSKCGNQIAMITNSQETQMVKTLGLNIGGGAVSDKAVIEEGNAGDKNDEIPWRKEAEDRFKRIPSFAQPMAKMSIMDYAKEKGAKEITLQIMDEVRERVGM